MVIVDGVRTPQGLLGGALRALTAQQLGQLVVRELLRRTRLDPARVEEVIMGCVGQQSDAPNIARVIALQSGIPISTPAYTVQRNCASGLQAIVSAVHEIRDGGRRIVVAGGTESMSTAPFVSRELRFGQRLRNAVLVDTLWEGLTDPVCGQVMGQTAETLARELAISRDDQDRFALESHKKAFRATREGRFKDELLALTIPKRAHGRELPPETVTQDEGINVGLTEQLLAQYPPVFQEGGTVTSGNACPISDGAAAVLVMAAPTAAELGVEPLGVIRSYAFAGVEPERMGLGPTLAVPLALERAGLALRDIQLIELNEAFAAQYLACERQLKFPRELANVNGGAIALGHPVGATGTRIVVSLLQEMKRRRLRYGVATLCVGGGQGGALVLERP